MATSPVFLLLLLAVSIRGSAAAWCVCRSEANETALQETLDWACGQGADCTQVATGGSCHSPDSVVAHCSYAVNSYYQRSSQTKGATCDFGGTATLTNTDPSTGPCKYPATASAAGTSTGNGTAPGAGAGAGAGTNSSSPGGATNPATPGMGGTFSTPIGGASGPSASIIGPESSGAAAACAGVRVFLGVASILAFFVQ